MVLHVWLITLSNRGLNISAEIVNLIASFVISSFLFWPVQKGGVHISAEIAHHDFSFVIGSFPFESMVMFVLFCLDCHTSTVGGGLDPLNPDGHYLCR